MAYNKIVFIIAMIMALSITMLVQTITRTEHQKPVVLEHNENDDSMLEGDKKIMVPSKRVSRFLAAADNPRAADHCNKDNEICYILGGINYKCCNNKCIDLSTDKDNCGVCKNKCKYRQSCCRGECVDLSYDKRHCGKCNNPCSKGDFCLYGMCSYA